MSSRRLTLIAVFFYFLLSAVHLPYTLYKMQAFLFQCLVTSPEKVALAQRRCHILSRSMQNSFVTWMLFLHTISKFRWLQLKHWLVSLGMHCTVRGPCIRLLPLVLYRMSL